MSRNRRLSRDGRTLAAALALAVMLAVVQPVSAQHHNRHDPRALAADPRLAPGQIAPLLKGLGDLHHEVTTPSVAAQLFFDQGLKLTYRFNHQEALRSFKEAARLDPDCAMAYWGWALVLGPNLNLPMRDELIEQAYQAIQLASARKHLVSEKERDYIDALAKRYSNQPLEDRTRLDEAYAEAMAALSAKYPDDPDAATLYVASLMNLTPWNYWTREGRPRSRSIEIALEKLEGAIEQNPRHIGALHYYIHLVEAVDPRRGERAADLLRGLAPGAGHLMHMPSHVYMQLGRYADSLEDNRKAVEADQDYITQCQAQGLYPLTYYPHNLHFLVWAQTMLGQSDDALETARQVAAAVPADLHDNAWALYDSFLSMPLQVMLRFEMWEKILAEPRPRQELRFGNGLWHFARGMALARTGRIEAAREELDKLELLAADEASFEIPVASANAGVLLNIARALLQGELLLKNGQTDLGLARLESAVRLEDSLRYVEPPVWFSSTRHALGDALLRAGRPVEAEVVYSRNLRRYPDNGFAVRGLARALDAQQRWLEASELRQRLGSAKGENRRGTTDTKSQEGAR